jgi:DNA-binding MarR family transcriptional regulator
MSTMVDESAGRSADRVALGPAVRQAWVGYRRRLDAELATAGFDDQGLPDGRVLHICARSPGITTAQIGRELRITRQGASKIVASLRARGYVALTDSPRDGREKIVTLTPRASAFIAAQRAAAQRIEGQLRSQLGADVLDGAYRLLEALGGPEQPRMSDYLKAAARTHGLGYVSEE